MPKVEIEMPEVGTIEWATLQMVLGKKVQNDALGDGPANLLFKEPKTAWRLYEEPLPVCRFCGGSTSFSGFISSAQINCSEHGCLSVQGKTDAEAKSRWRSINEVKP